MAIRKYVNNFTTTLNGAITNVATTLTLTSASGLPTLGSNDVYRLTIYESGVGTEVVEVTDDTSSPTLTITRGVDGTSGLGFSDGALVELRATANSFEHEDDTVTFSRTSAGYTAINQTIDGILLTASGMNTTNKYTQPLLFGSTDPQLTTSNPKKLAAIVGEATENYGGDSDGGMGITFLGSSDNPGTAPTLTEMVNFTTSAATFSTDIDMNTNNITNVGTAEIGTSTSIDGASLSVLASLNPTLAFRNTEDDATIKFGSLAVGHYTNAEEAHCVFRATSTSSDNNITIGGGTSQLNASTSVKVYSAANNTTVDGTEIAEFTINGLTMSADIDMNTNDIIMDDDTGIKDPSGNYYVQFNQIASSDNYFIMGNSTSSPTLEVAGADANVSMAFQCKASAVYRFLGTSSVGAILELREDTDNGTDYVRLRAPASIASSFDLTLPDAASTNDNGFITWDTSGNATWEDYEEGTFTPVLVGTSTAGTNSYSLQAGNYTKIGQTVVADFIITLDGTGGALDSTGSLTITGWPFSSAATRSSASVYCTGLNLSAAGAITARFASTTEVYLSYPATSGQTNLPDTQATDSFSVRGTIVYRTSA